MGVDGQRHAPAALPPGKRAGTPQFRSLAVPQGTKSRPPLEMHMQP